MALNRIFIKEKSALNSSKNSWAKGTVIVLGHRVCSTENRPTIEFAVKTQLVRELAESNEGPSRAREDVIKKSLEVTNKGDNWMAYLLHTANPIAARSRKPTVL